MDNLQWFKFSPSHWFMGRIQRCSEIAQARFIRLCCIYWNNECIVHQEDAEIELGQDEFNQLLKLKIIELNEDESIAIKFLDDQYHSCLELGNKRSQAAKARWSKAKGKENSASAMQLHKPAMQDNADKIREEDIREEDILEATPKHKLITWLEENAPRVQKMSNPITNEEAERLKKDFSSDVIIEIFTNMHNYKPLTKTVSANLTFRRWAKNRTTETKEKFIPQPPKI
tara:strand:- start:1157 stop:1843 length:687 start_codon:yes stop_codon:yes gene_type:complete